MVYVRIPHGLLLRGILDVVAGDDQAGVLLFAHRERLARKNHFTVFEAEHAAHKAEPRIIRRRARVCPCPAAVRALHHSAAHVQKAPAMNLNKNIHHAVQHRNLREIHCLPGFREHGDRLRPRLSVVAAQKAIDPIVWRRLGDAAALADAQKIAVVHPPQNRFTAQRMN